MNNISKAINCVNCNEVLVSPIFLPCGCSICEKHTIDVYGPIRCCSCQIDHPLPPSGNFPPNKALSSILVTQIGTKNFGQKHANAKQSCSRLDELLASIEVILNDPYNFTYEAIRSLMNVVQLKGEEMKLEIDKQIDQILGKLEEYNENCKMNLKTTDYLTRSEEIRLEKEDARKLLDKWENILNDDAKLDQIEWTRVDIESKKAIEWFECTLDLFKSDLLLQQFCKFHHEIEEYFGKFEIEPIFKFQ
jgi:hypothetical protein